MCAEDDLIREGLEQVVARLEALAQDLEEVAIEAAALDDDPERHLEYALVTLRSRAFAIRLRLGTASDQVYGPDEWVYPHEDRGEFTLPGGGAVPYWACPAPPGDWIVADCREHPDADGAVVRELVWQDRLDPRRVTRTRFRVTPWSDT